MTCYHEQYTWSHPLTEHVMAHTDGAVSLLIGWEGIDCELLTQTEREQLFGRIYQLLAHLPANYCLEHHLWREFDRQLADDYLAMGDSMVRGQQFAQPLREDMANHLGSMALSNSVAMVITRRPEQRFFVKPALKAQARAAVELESVAEDLMRFLPGAEKVDIDGYIARIGQSFYRPGFLAGRRPRLDPRFSAREQLVREKPVTGSSLDFDGHHTKVLYVYMYPDVSPGWFGGIASLSCAMHCVQIVEALDTKAAMRKSESDADIAEGLMSRKGRSFAAKGLNDRAAFQAFVAENELELYRNAFIIHLHGSQDEVDRFAPLVADWIEQVGGQIRETAYIQLPFFRAAQPGQGYRCPMMRPDHTWQVGDMTPAQVYAAGDPAPESLRIGAAGQLVGFNFTKLELAHAFTCAKTGGGKGVDKVATIVESYPFGIDWYIAEIGESYRWTVEGFGGIYSKVDPSQTVINPLPPYAIANTDTDGLPLDAVLAGSTVQALAFILTDGCTTLDVHQEASAQTALQLLYAVPGEEEAPVLPLLLDELQALDNFDSEQQVKAAKGMAENLDSFLSTTEGRLFANQNNLALSEGITGVDLKDVDRASPKLLKFYLVFLSLRFSHLAFANRRPARILLDEMHKFVRIAPEVVGSLISELARMGRKDGASIDLVTQNKAEVDSIESEVLGSMALKSLLYREDEHEELAKRIAMPQGALDVWRQYPYPLGLDWRPAMRSVGDAYYNLHLSFPRRMLDLSESKPAGLDLKEAIGATTDDPFERLSLFHQNWRES